MTQRHFGANPRGELKNQFSWSYSRDRTFGQCLRRYYWHYYGSWGGWEREAGAQAQLAYRLKQMSSLTLWAGEVVHLAAERAVKDVLNLRAPNAAMLKQWARNTLNRRWQESLDEKWRVNPKHHLNLFEHYYRREIAPEQRAALREKIYNCIDNLFTSAPFEEFQHLGPASLISVEKLQSFETGGVPCYVKIDLAYRRADGEVALVDWKSGARDDADREQMLNYALYAAQELRVTPDQVRLALVYLKDGTSEEWQPRAEELIAFREKIFRSLEAMRELLADAAANRAAKKNFPRTEQRENCAWCAFRELCFENADPQCAALPD